MQEPLIQKILKLTKYTFARDLNAKHGVRQQILGPENFSNHLAEISSLMKQVCNISLFWDQASVITNHDDDLQNILLTRWFF